jgi:hypothetical protein
VSYSDQQFGRDLLAQLATGYDPVRIARWAFHQFLETGAHDTSPAVRDALVDLFTMEEGEEFHIPEEELRTRAMTFVGRDGGN